MERPELKTQYEAGKNAVIDFWVVCCIVCRLGFPGILSEYYRVLTPLFDYGSTFLQVILMMVASGSTVNEVKLLDLKKKYNMVYLMLALLIVQSLLVASSKTSELTTCIRFTITAMFGLWLADHYDTKRLFEIICNAQAVFLFMNLLLFFVFRNIGFYYDEEGLYMFRGLLTRKNAMGEALAFCLVLQVAMLCMKWNDHEKISKFQWFVLAAQCFLLLETQATGALFTAIIPILYLLLNEWKQLKLPRFQWGYVYIVASVGFLFAALTILPLFSPLLELIGKDATLSNRTTLWEKVIPFMLDSHTLTGYGLLMFWYDGTALQNLQNRFSRNSWFREMTYGAHNTLLEMWLDVGLIGIGIFFLVLLYSFRRVRRYSENQYLACSAFMMPLLIRGLTERSFTNSNYLTLFLFVMLGVACTGSDVKPPRYPRRPFLNQQAVEE